MRRTGLGVAVVCLALGILPVAAQDDGGNIAQIISYSAKPGMEKEMIEAVQRHLDWHREQNDPWTWLGWEVVSGDDVGTYGAGTFGHNWADFDNSPVSRDADEADVAKNVLPYTNLDSVRFYAALPDVSHVSETPTPMHAILVFRLRQGKTPDFLHLIGKFHEGIQKTEWPVHYSWHMLVNGGEGPEFVLVLPRANWAAFAPPSKPFAAMLEEAFGRTEAQSLLSDFGDALESSSSHAIRTRPDLSYIPEGN